jgi:RNA polymerase sigma factor (sigma-70 family)
MPWQTTHPSLLIRLHDGSDHSAWRDFDAQYGELIVRYCLSQGLQYCDAEDVRQIVMLSLSKALPKFQYLPQRGHFRSYLGVVVRRAISQYRRHQCPTWLQLSLDKEEWNHPSSSVESHWSLADTDGLDASWEVEWVRHHYRRAMHIIRATQDPRSVEVFEQLVAGRTPREVATDCNVSEALVHKTKQRMRDRLKAIIQQQILQESQVRDGP